MITDLRVDLHTFIVSYPAVAAIVAAVTSSQMMMFLNASSLNAKTCRTIAQFRPQRRKVNNIFHLCSIRLHLLS